MINFKKITKIAFISTIILAQTLGPISSVVAFADTSELKPYSSVMFKAPNEEQLKARIFQDKSFIFDHTVLADKLGFAWCGGTRSKTIGKDFDFSKDGDNYILKGHYNGNDPYAAGYRSNETLKMTISNVKFYLDPDSIKYGPEKMKDPKPFSVSGYHINNGGDESITASPSLSYNKQSTKSHSSNFGFTEKIGLKETFVQTAGFLGTGASHETEMSLELTAEQGWSDSSSDALTGSHTLPLTVTVPKHSTKNISMTGLTYESEKPYTADAYVTYNITYHGFLREDNARLDITKDRPTIDLTFGNNDISAVEDITKQYNNRNINGFTKWDWNWSNINYPKSETIEETLKWLTRKRGSTKDGKFTFTDSSDITATVGPTIPYTGSSTEILSNKPTVSTPINNLLLHNTSMK